MSLRTPAPASWYAGGNACTWFAHRSRICEAGASAARQLPTLTMRYCRHRASMRMLCSSAVCLLALCTCRRSPVLGCRLVQ